MPSLRGSGVRNQEPAGWGHPASMSMSRTIDVEAKAEEAGARAVTSVAREDAAEWSGPAGPARRPKFTWSAFLWSLVYPQRGHRILPTVPGVVLIALSFGNGTAA